MTNLLPLYRNYLHPFLFAAVFGLLIVPGMINASELKTTPLLHSDSASVSKQQQPYGVNYFGRSVVRRSVLKDIGFVGKTFVSDALYLYSSPARMNKRTALLFGGVLAIGAGIYFSDDVISSALRRNEDHWTYKPFRELGDAIEPVGRQATMNKYVFGTAVLSYIIGFERLSRMSAEILESYLIAGIPKVAANKISGRPRPLDGMAWNHWSAFGKGQSYYSGHSSHAFQIARVIDEHIHFLPIDIALYTAAASVGVQRVSSGWHWASDVWIGSVYGLVVADALVGHHRMQWLSVQPMSFLDGPSQGINLAVRF